MDMGKRNQTDPQPFNPNHSFRVGRRPGVKTCLDLRLLLSASLEVALRHIIVDALTLLAVVEVLKTALTYCSDGRVRVTFIVDTVLVVMLTEIISR